MKVFLFYIFILITLRVTAQHFITETEALKIAMNCMHHKLQHEYFDNLLFTEKNISSIILVNNSDNIPLYYIVSFDPKGWVLISSTRTYYPVIGFSWESSFNYPPEIPAVKMWMKNQESKIIKSINLETIHPNIITEWLKYENPEIIKSRFRNEKIVLPLLTTKWNQGMFYNEFCPKDPAGPDGRTYAGCVATAIGQVMNYFRYPLQGQGGSYTSQFTAYGIHTINYSLAKYKWNMMPLKLTRSNHPVAELLYHIGVSVDMHYGPYGSGMWNHKAAHTLKTFFGYSDSTQYIFRDTTTINWTAMLRNFLDQKIPLYYAGWADSQYVSGHAFVCDGYQDSTFFHFNWGWGGAYDGYYNIDNLFVGGYDFSTMHEAVINALPSSNYPYYCSNIDTLTTLDGTIDDGSGPLYNYQNNSQCRWLIAPNDTVENITLWFQKCILSDDDVVRIYDGPSTNSPLLAVASASNVPQQIVSSSKYVLVEFKTNNTQTADGFLLGYSAKQIKTCSGMKTLTDPSGFISDGSGKYNYQNSNVCRWKIQPPDTTFIHMKFLEFDVDSTDKLKITDLSTNNIIGEFQGSILPNDIFLWTHSVLITFTSSATSSAKGFEIFYQTSQQNIEQYLHNQLRVYPNPTKNNLSIELPIDDISQLKIKLLTLTGTEVKYQLFSKFENPIEIYFNVKPGIYLLNVESKFFTKTQKIIIIP